MRFSMVITAAGLSFLFSACGLSRKAAGMPAHLESTAYLSWYESARYPLRDTVLIDGITYVATFVPLQAEVAMQLRNALITAEEAKILLNEPAEEMQFRVKIMLPQAGTDVFHYKLQAGEDIDSRTAYFAFGIKNDFSLEFEGTEKRECSAVHFSRGMSNQPVSTVIAYFPSAKGPFGSLVLNLTVFRQEARFSFDSEAFKKLPKLDL